MFNPHKFEGSWVVYYPNGRRSVPLNLRAALNAQRLFGGQIERVLFGLFKIIVR